MASWERGLIAELTRLAGGENPVEKIDYEGKLIVIKSDARLEPEVLRWADQEVSRVAAGYRVVQLT